MKRLRNLLIVLSVVLSLFGKMLAQDISSLPKNPGKEIERDELLNDNVVIVDTVFRTDSVIIGEVITSSDVIHQTEKVIRYEETGNFSSNYEPSQNQPILKGENHDTVISQEMTDFENSREGGRFIWVPDSMFNLVTDVLNGNNILDVTSTDISENSLIDLNEKVIFRGDTIPMMLRDRNLGRFDRGLFNYLFIPKGIWQLGITASYGEFSTEDLEILDLISDVDFKGRIFSVRPYFAYFINNNISLGMRLGYTSGKASIGSFNLDIDEDVNFNIKDVMYKSSSYTGAVTFSQYLGIARKGRFGVFNEVELALSGGASDFVRPYNGIKKETHTSTFQVGLNFSPGLCVFIVDRLSFNVSFGVFGLYLKNEKQKVDGEDLGSRITSGANFRFNIFNINFGIAVNI